jgi:alkaline phosphatase D
MSLFNGLSILFFVLIVRLDSASHNYVVERIAFGSCFNPNRGGEVWKLIQSFSPQQLILLGDQFYADMTSEFGYRKTKLELIAKEYSLFTSSQDWQNLVDSLNGWTATFDDHDYGINNGDKTFRYRNESQDLFWLFTNTSSVGLNNERKSGIYSSKVVRVPLNGHHTSNFVYKIIMLDSRSNKDRSGRRGDFLGKEQWEWLAGELLDPEPQLFIIGSSIQVLPDDKIVEETWNEFPRSRTRLLKLLTAVQRSGIHPQDVLLLSGDIHSAEISQARCALSTSIDTNTISSVEKGDIMSLSEVSVSPTRLVELTSSGLSHTFTHTNVLPSAGNSKSAGDKTVQVASRGFSKEIFYSLYQVRLMVICLY